MRTSDKIGLASLLVAILALYPAYVVLWKKDSPPSPTTVTTGNSTTDTTGEEPGDVTTTRPLPPPTRPPTTQSPAGGATFSTTIALGQGLDIDRRKRSNGQATGVDLVNSGSSIDYSGAWNLGYAPVAVSGRPTQQECTALYQQPSNTWPTIRFDVWGEGQDFCVVTDAEAVAAFRIDKIQVTQTTSEVRLSVIVWN